MQVKEFKCRASAIGQIMTNDRSGKNMGQTAKTYCETWLKEQIYNSTKEITTKQMQKGCEVEDVSIDFIADYLNLGMIFKNEERFENDFITGTPDIITSDTVIDAKNSWDCFSFPLFVNDIPNKNYYYQLNGYMWLTGKIKSILAYTLIDTPEHLIERDAYWWCKNNGFEELDGDIYEKFYNNQTYKDVDYRFKIKTFKADYNPATIEAIKLRVIECRTYINELLCKLK